MVVVLLMLLIAFVCCYSPRTPSVAFRHLPPWRKDVVYQCLEFVFSAVEQAHCALVACDSNCGFLQPALNIQANGVVTVLFDSYMAGTSAPRNSCHLCAFCVHQTTMHHIPSLHKSHIRRVHACLACFNQQPALLAEWQWSCTCYCGKTGVGRILKSESVQSVDLKSWTWTRTLDLLITSPAL